jgi:FkbM family methyltransferase
MIGGTLGRLVRLVSGARSPAGELTGDQVRWAYRLFLDREPEDAAVVAAHLARWSTPRELRQAMMTSSEFRTKNPDLGLMWGRNVVVKEMPDGFRLFLDLGDYHVGLTLARGAFEPTETAFVRSSVKAGDSVVDVGANVGYYAMLLATLVGPGGAVAAFEPLPENADLLARSIAENGFGERVSLHRQAVGDQPGTLHLAVDPMGSNSGTAYLVEPTAAIRSDLERVEVQVVALDAVALRRPVTFVKMDAEGAELLVVRGARQLLAEDRPVVLCEVNPGQLAKVSRCTPADLVQEMASLGYGCEEIGGRALEPSDVGAGELESVVFRPR